MNATHSSTDITNEIFSVSVKDDLIEPIYFKDKTGKKRKAKTQSRLLLYPRGRCLLVKSPTRDKVESFKHLYLESIKTDKFNRSEFPSSTLKGFLMDPVNDPLIYPIDLQMKGDHIKVPLNKKTSWNAFTIRVSRSHHVEDDPLFDCKEYSEENTYGECVRKELKGIFEQKLNCSPPVLAKGTDKMCNERFHQTSEESAEIFDLFVNNYFNFEPSVCKTPCTQTNYEVRLNSVVESEKLEIKLTFEPVVQVTRSVFSFTMVDFLTSLGGSVRNSFS